MPKLTSQTKKKGSCLTRITALFCFTVPASAEMKAFWGQEWSGPWSEGGWDRFFGRQSCLLAALKSAKWRLNPSKCKLPVGVGLQSRFSSTRPCLRNCGEV